MAHCEADIPFTAGFSFVKRAHLPLHVLLVLLGVSCTSVRRDDKGIPGRKPDVDAMSMDSTALNPFRRAIVSAALLLRGKPYCFGGQGPDCFDCSGYVGEVFKRHGIAIPRTTTDLVVSSCFVDVRADQVLPGDLVFFDLDARGSVTHVGIMLSRDFMIHASTSRGIVVENVQKHPFCANTRTYRSYAAKK
jgi:hypothetical protein